MLLSSLAQAPNLMAAAIAESGAGLPTPTNQEMQEIGTKYASSVNCSVTDVISARFLIAKVVANGEINRQHALDRNQPRS